MHSHSVSARSVGYALLMHARVAVPTPVYPFSDGFITEFSEVRIQDAT
jgi:hypothetical protein